MNAFDELVAKLNNGELSYGDLQRASRAQVRHRKDLPDEIKSILSGESRSSAGILFSMFQPFAQVIGAIELAFRRGYAAGVEDTKKKELDK